MASYISTSDNRLYCAAESTYGAVSQPQSQERISNVSLTVKQTIDRPERRDKTGSRTFLGVPVGGRKTTAFELHTYFTPWTDLASPPPHDALFRAALGRSILSVSALSLAAGTTASTLSFSTPHGLSAGQAVSAGNELRFVQLVLSATSVQLNAPFSVAPAAGTLVNPTSTYLPGTSLGSVTLFDYWSPSTAIQRILPGAGIDQFELALNGDYHEFVFRGYSQDLLDSSTFAAGAGSLSAYPSEPSSTAAGLSVVPGNLGQAWLGALPNQFFTLLSAKVTLDNDLDSRVREYGARTPGGVIPGQRKVSLAFELYGTDDSATTAIYAAAKSESPISVMFQLGQQPGQLCGILLNNLIPEIPDFNDSDRRVSWTFAASRAHGIQDDEIYVAFA